MTIKTYTVTCPECCEQPTFGEHIHTAEQLVSALDDPAAPGSWDETRGDCGDCARWAVVRRAAAWYLVSAGAGGMDEATRYDCQAAARAAMAAAVEEFDQHAEEAEQG